MKQHATACIPPLSTAAIENNNHAARAFAHPKVFRIGEMGSVLPGGGGILPTGYAALDAELSGGGWQQPGLTEILCDHTGIGELSLLMKGLGAAVTRPGDAMHMLWVLPQGQPWIPYAPALAQCGISLENLAIVRTKNTADALWAAEQGLKSGACLCVLLRLNEAYCSPLSLRRLLQAAIAGGSAALLLRPLAAAVLPSPAGTRIALHPEQFGTLRVDLLKRRGLPPGKSVRAVARSLWCLSRDKKAVQHSGNIIAKRATPQWLERLLAGKAEASHLIRERRIAQER